MRTKTFPESSLHRVNMETTCIASCVGLAHVHGVWRGARIDDEVVPPSGKKLLHLLSATAGGCPHLRFYQWTEVAIHTHIPHSAYILWRFGQFLGVYSFVLGSSTAYNRLKYAQTLVTGSSM